MALWSVDAYSWLYVGMFSSTEFSPHSYLSQHTHSQEIYDPLKQFHSWRPVAQMALLHKQWVNGFCHHTLLQQGHAWVHNMHPAL